MTVVLLDRAIGLFSLLILPLIFAPMFSQVIQRVFALRSLLLTVGLLAIGVLAGFLVCLYSDSFINRFSGGALNRLTKNEFVRQVLGTIRTYRKNSGVLLAAMGTSLLANSVLVWVTRSTAGHPDDASAVSGASARFSYSAFRSAPDRLAPSTLPRRC